MIAEPPPAQAVYEPHGAARDLFHTREAEVLIEGPAGTGKTRGALEKGNAIALKYPGARGLITRKTRASLTQSVLVTFEQKVLGSEHPLVRNGPTRAHRDSYRYPNGSEIVVGGMDNADRVMSTEYDFILGFEWTEASEDDHEKLTTRLRNGVVPYQQIVSDCNPGPPGHWLNRRASAGRMNRLHSLHEDNPVLWDRHSKQWTRAGAAYIATLDRLTGHRLARLRHGKWTAAEGLVYPEFDQSHLIDQMPSGWQTWTKRRSIDFGYNDPFVCQWWAGKDDRWYLYREVYMSGRIVQDHAKQICALSKGETYESTVSDHDLEDRETLARHGVETTPASKDITTGIDAVKSRLLKSGDGKPRLYFLRDALVERDQNLSDAKRPTSTLEEFDAYCWKQNKDNHAKDEPVDAHNHGMDAMRYMVMGLLGGGSYVGIVEQEPARTGWYKSEVEDFFDD